MGLSWLPLLPVLGAFAQSAKVQLPAVGAEPPKVISHIGRTPDAGHYVYYNRSQIGVWICYDDDKCFEVEASEVLSSQAYLVLYVSSIQDDFGERAEKLEKSPERDRSRSRGRADRPSQDKQKPEHGELVESRPELEDLATWSDHKQRRISAQEAVSILQDMRWDLPRSRKWKFDDADNSAPLTGCHAYRSRQDMRRDSAPLTAETHHPKGKRCKSCENMVESLVKNGWFGRDIGSPSLALRSCHLWTRAPRYLPVWNGHTALQRLRAHISAQQLLIRLSQLHRIRTSAAPKDLIPLDEVVEVHDQKYVRRPATTLFPARPGHLRPEVPIEEELRNQRRSRDKIFERMWKAASSSNAMLSWDCEVCKALAGQNCYM